MPSRHALDPEGLLYDSQVRDSLTSFALSGDIEGMEAASAIRSAAHALESLRARGARGGGISAGAMDILLRLGLGRTSPVSLTELSRSMGVSARNVTGLIDTLERSALVERVPNPEDRRSVLAQITRAGQEKISGLRQPTQMAMKALFLEFSSSELALLRGLCLRVVENAARLNP